MGAGWLTLGPSPGPILLSRASAQNVQSRILRTRELINARGQPPAAVFAADGDVIVFKATLRDNVEDAAGADAVHFDAEVLGRPRDQWRFEI